MAGVFPALLFTSRKVPVEIRYSSEVKSWFSTTVHAPTGRLPPEDPIQRKILSSAKDSELLPVFPLSYRLLNGEEPLCHSIARTYRGVPEYAATVTYT